MSSLTDTLKAGDCLCYSAKGFFGWVISLKTWHKIAHVEIYIGGGRSVASRDGIGVDSYPLRTEQLYGVYRANHLEKFNLQPAMEWFFNHARGQKYDWKAILSFVGFADTGSANKQMCSEFATRFYRQGGLDPFPSEDADQVAPFQYTINPLFTRIL